MTNEQLLQAISDMMDQKLDEKLKPICIRFDKVNNRLDEIDERLNIVDARIDMLAIKLDRTTKELEDFQLDTNIAERKVTRSIHKLQDEMETVIEVLKINELIPVRMTN